MKGQARQTEYPPLHQVGAAVWEAPNPSLLGMLYMSVLQYWIPVLLVLQYCIVYLLGTCPYAGPVNLSIQAE